MTILNAIDVIQINHTNFFLKCTYCMLKNKQILLLLKKIAFKQKKSISRDILVGSKPIRHQKTAISTTINESVKFGVKGFTKL